MAKILTLIIISSGIMTAVSAQRLPITECVLFCTQNEFDIGDCIIPALSETGPCYECGPLKENPDAMLCDGDCVDTSTDRENCGSCATECSDEQICTDGLCTCPGTEDNEFGGESDLDQILSSGGECA